MSSDKTEHSLQKIYLAYFWRNSDISGLAAELDFFVWPLVVAHRATIAQGGVGARNGHPNTVSDLACLWSEDRGGGQQGWMRMSEAGANAPEAALTTSMTALPDSGGIFQLHGNKGTVQQHPPWGSNPRPQG